MKIQSVVGLIPLLAVEVLDSDVLAKLPEFTSRMEWYLKHRTKLAGLISNWKIGGTENRKLLSLLRGHRVKALLKRMLDETQFLSDHGRAARCQKFTSKIPIVTRPAAGPTK